MGKKNKPQGYWLFALDVTNHVESLIHEPLATITINYIASNIWPNMTNELKSLYKHEARIMRTNGENSRPPGIISLDKCLSLMDENRLFDIVHH